MESALERTDGPVPTLDLPVAADAGVFDRAAASLVLLDAGRHPDASEVERSLATSLDAGMVDDSLGPSEVLTWYAQRLAVHDHGPLATALRGARAATILTARARLATPPHDLFTDIYLARVDDEAVRTNGGRVPPTAAVLDTGWACTPAPHGSSATAVAEEMTALAAAIELLDRTGATCTPPIPTDLASQATRWLAATAGSEVIDATAVDALAAAGTLADNRALPTSVGRVADRRLAAALRTDTIEPSPSVVLIALDRLRATGARPRLGPDTAATFASLAAGHQTVTLQPNALRMIAYAEILRLTTEADPAAIGRATRWNDPRLGPLDRLVLAVAAHDRRHLDLAALRHAEPGPTSAAIALRAQTLQGGRCDDDVERFVRRTTRAIDASGAPSSANPFTAAGYASLLSLARRCHVDAPSLQRVAATVRGHLRSLRRDDGTYGPAGADAADPTLTATLLLASCRLGEHRSPPTETAARRLTAPLRRPDGGAALGGSPSPSVEATLTVATIDAAAAHGCKAIT